MVTERVEVTAEPGGLIPGAPRSVRTVDAEAGDSRAEHVVLVGQIGESVHHRRDLVPGGRRIPVQVDVGADCLVAGDTIGGMLAVQGEGVIQRLLSFGGGGGRCHAKTMRGARASRLRHLSRGEERADPVLGRMRIASRS